MLLPDREYAREKGLKAEEVSQEEARAAGLGLLPPTGRTGHPASLATILRHIREGDDHWSVEAPGTATAGSRENWASLIWADHGCSNGFW